MKKGKMPFGKGGKEEMREEKGRKGKSKRMKMRMAKGR